MPLRIWIVDTAEQPVIKRDDVLFALKLAQDRGIRCEYEYSKERQRAFSVGPCQGAAVDDRVRAKGRQLAAVPDELRAIAVKVLGLRHVVWLELAAMHEQQFVAGDRELLDGSAADEPRAAQNNDFQTTAFRSCS